METKWYHGRTQGGGFGVWTLHGSYNVLDHTAPGVDAKENARLIALAPEFHTLVMHAARQDIAPDVMQKRALKLLQKLADAQP